MVALRRSTAATIAAASSANNSLLTFVQSSTSMPVGGTPDTLSIQKLNQLGIEIPNAERIAEIDSATFEAVMETIEQVNASGHAAEIIDIVKTSVAVWENGTNTGEQADAILVKTIVDVPNGSEIKPVSVNIVLRSKSTASTFLQTFKKGEKGVFVLNGSTINNQPAIWARVM